MNICSLAWQ